ncbi:MAG: methylamine utilization protein MauG [Rhodobacteraceae bacterium]|nr:methylamine utilization protein MauG [Paracoccaceae bacterium]
MSHVLALCLLPLGAQAGPLPVPLQEDAFVAVDPAQARLGQLLFFDKVLSGNRNIACATCHAPAHGTSDGLSLGVGEGGQGVGPERTAGTGRDRIRARIARNAPALWNLGAHEIEVLFHDGRLSRSDIYDNGFDSPAQEWLPPGLSGILAAQALFPLASRFEMAGDPVENELAGRAFERVDYVWPLVAERVRAIPGYPPLFAEAFDDVAAPADITIAHIANAIAAFQAFEFRSHDSPFDAFLAGDAGALGPAQRRGMALFYGKAGCDGCHSGPLLSDHRFHALGLPFFGPGRVRPWEPVRRDVGRMGASDRLEDAYRFRTPMLRNVALSAPYGHNGAWPTLEGMVRHHLNPAAARAAWKPALAALPPAPWLEDSDFVGMQDRAEMARLAARLDIAPRPLGDAEVADLVAFLHALTGTASVEGRLGRPDRVPSGLEVE